ncbi:MAG: hypothetical protein EA374_00755 [Acholeplasmatales bacterium]|nr:MAG: hypothetical protein EA374_00755 [Acholeplasmatales bacterium]
MKQTKRFKRTHTYTHESDIEKGKITEERRHAQKARKQQDALLNARVHKKWLKALLEEDAID